MNKDDETVVYNPSTQNFVAFKIDQNTGEIIINSTDSRDDDESCIVTTWKNLPKLYSKKRFNGKRHI